MTEKLETQKPLHPLTMVYNKLADKKTDEYLLNLSGGTLNISQFKTAVHAELNNNERLKEKPCTPDSIFNAITKAASLNLIPGNEFGLVSFVPFGDTLAFILGYKGMVELAYRAGLLMRAHLIYDTDTDGKGVVIKEGTHAEFLHTQTPFDQPLGKIIGAYSKAQQINGGFTDFHAMRIDKIHAIRDTSKGWLNAIKYKNEKEHFWHKYEEEMIKKTVIRAHFKVLPKLLTEKLNLPHMSDDGIIIDHEEVNEIIQPEAANVNLKNHDINKLIDEIRSN